MTKSPSTPNKIAAVWGLTVHDCIAQTRRAEIYRADGPQGPCALKLYKHIGWSGEGAALPFLRDLDAGVGVQIYRSNFWRAAVLMEWLEGPDLTVLANKGDHASAVAHLSALAAKVQATTFKRRYLYRKLSPAYRRDLAKTYRTLKGTDMPGALPRAIKLLDHLISTTKQERVIHGDLNLGNVILTKDGPRLIDPKGLRADPALEFARALRTSANQAIPEDLAQRLDRTAGIIAQTVDIAPQRMIQWAAVEMAMGTFRIRKGATYRRERVPMLTAMLDVAER